MMVLWFFIRVIKLFYSGEKRINGSQKIGNYFLNIGQVFNQARMGFIY